MVSLPAGFQVDHAQLASMTEEDGFWIAGIQPSKGSGSPEDGEILSLGWVSGKGSHLYHTPWSGTTHFARGRWDGNYADGKGPSNVLGAVASPRALFVGLRGKGDAPALSGFQTEAKHTQVRCKKDGQSCAVLVWANQGESASLASLGQKEPSSLSAPAGGAASNLSVFEFPANPQP